MEVSTTEKREEASSNHRVSESEGTLESAEGMCLHLPRFTDLQPWGHLWSFSGSWTNPVSSTFKRDPESDIFPCLHPLWFNLTTLAVALLLLLFSLFSNQQPGWYIPYVSQILALRISACIKDSSYMVTRPMCSDLTWCPSLPASYPSSVPAILVLLLYHDTRCASASGPLYWQCPLVGMIFPRVDMAHCLASFRASLKCYLLSDA